MSTIELVELIIKAHTKEEIIKLLNANRRPIKESKYC